MDEPLIFDRIKAIDARRVASANHERHRFEVVVQHLVDDVEIARETLPAYMTDSAIYAARTPVEAYVALSVEWMGNATLNDGLKLERLQQDAAQDPDGIPIGRPADEQDYGRPLVDAA